jgi:hypothetical protein
MAAKLTTLPHKIAIKLHLVAVSPTICSSRSRQHGPETFGYTLAFLTPWRRILHGKPITQPFMEPESLSSFSKGLVNGLYPEPDASIPGFPTLVP